MIVPNIPSQITDPNWQRIAKAKAVDRWNRMRADNYMQAYKEYDWYRKQTFSIESMSRPTFTSESLVKYLPCGVRVSIEPMLIESAGHPAIAIRVVFDAS